MRYEIHYHDSGAGWWGYRIYCDGRPIQGAELRSKKEAMKDAELALKRIQRAEQQPLAA